MKSAKTKKTKKAPKTEPFFRPFSALAKDRSKKATTSKASKEASKDQEKEPQAKAKTKTKVERLPAAEPVVPTPIEDGEDSRTFAIYMSGVQALDERVGRVPKTAPRTDRKVVDPSIVEDMDSEARSRMRSLVTDGLRFETIDDGERLEGRRLDLDPRELRRLRHGKYAVDAKLDLHGLSVVEARPTVEAFVKKRWHDGDRVVVLVHGKGSHSPRGHGALRGEISAWLSQGRSARYVAAFSTAPVDQGGTGALLVLLAR